MKRSENIKAAIDVRSAFQGEAQAVSKQEKPSQSPVTLRVTDEERERLKSMAAGMSVSAYIRKCIFAGDATRRKRRSHMPAMALNLKNHDVGITLIQKDILLWACSLTPLLVGVIL